MRGWKEAAEPLISMVERDTTFLMALVRKQQSEIASIKDKNCGPRGQKVPQ